MELSACFLRFRVRFSFKYSLTVTAGATILVGSLSKLNACLNGVFFSQSEKTRNKIIITDVVIIVFECALSAVFDISC